MNEETQPIGYFVRHGQTTGNAAGTFRGSIDYPLDDQGKADAKTLGKWFGQKQIGAVYASPLKRAQDTAREIAMPKGIDVQTVPALKPIDVGFLAGEPKEDHRKTMDYFSQHPDEKIPAGESINDFRKRTQPPLKQILAKFGTSQIPGVAVVHSSIIHELNHIVSGNHNQTLVKPGGIVGVYKNPAKPRGLELKALTKPETKERVPYHG